jgi:hypothetical protein
VKVLVSWRNYTAKIKRDGSNGHWQRKLEQVTNKIIGQYEAELSKASSHFVIVLIVEFEYNYFQLRESLKEAESVIEKYEGQRDKFQQDMKKAFMRGVCALNLEAMAMFKVQPQHLN